MFPFDPGLSVNYFCKKLHRDVFKEVKGNIGKKYIKLEKLTNIFQALKTIPESFDSFEESSLV